MEGKGREKNSERQKDFFPRGKEKKGRMKKKGGVSGPIFGPLIFSELSLPNLPGRKGKEKGKRREERKEKPTPGHRWSESSEKIQYRRRS